MITINEKYNPEIHCCEYWYKDICKCVSKTLKDWKTESRDKAVKRTIKFLESCGCKYHKSKVENVVYIDIEYGRISISLKSPLTELKIKVGNGKWRMSKKAKFKEYFKSL